MSSKVEQDSSSYVGRFAPTPSGRLHMGNLFALLVAYLDARQHHGRIVLRMEDLDPDRTSQKRATEMLHDLEWFGFSWETPLMYQSDREEAYQAAFQELYKRDLVYPCFCSRADLHSVQAPHVGDEVRYAGTCAQLTRAEREARAARQSPSYRIRVTDTPWCFDDSFQGPQRFNLDETSGDFIIRRSDGVYAYQLAVVVDDAAMGVTHVVRGVDLLSSVPRQRYLQTCLALSFVSYGHVPLIVDEKGRRLAKRNKDASLVYLKEEAHWSPQRILGHLAWIAGLIDYDEPCSLDLLVREAQLGRLRNKRTIVWR